MQPTKPLSHEASVISAGVAVAVLSFVVRRNGRAAGAESQLGKCCCGGQRSKDANAILRSIRIAYQRNAFDRAVRTHRRAARPSGSAASQVGVIDNVVTAEVRGLAGRSPSLRNFANAGSLLRRRPTQKSLPARGDDALCSRIACYIDCAGGTNAEDRAGRQGRSCEQRDC